MRSGAGHDGQATVLPLASLGLKIPLESNDESHVLSYDARALATSPHAT